MYPGSQSRLSESIVTSTTSIVVNTDVIRLTGTTAVATISAPPGIYNTVLIIVPVDGAVATTTAGNISLAVTMPQSRATLLYFSKSLNKWYPGAIS